MTEFRNFPARASICYEVTKRILTRFIFREKRSSTTASRVKFKLAVLDGNQRRRGLNTPRPLILQSGHQGQPLGRLEVGWDGRTPFKSGRASLSSLRLAGAAERFAWQIRTPMLCYWVGGCSAFRQQFFQNKEV
jgi:hypothetical protein